MRRPRRRSVNGDIADVSTELGVVTARIAAS